MDTAQADCVKKNCLLALDFAKMPLMTVEASRVFAEQRRFYANLFWAAALLSTTAAAALAPVPTVFDPDLQISLVASEPEIATPIGAVVDAQGRSVGLLDIQDLLKAGLF